jgi:hypothetical protein
VATVHETGEVAAAVDDVWALVSDFGGMVRAFGLAVELEGEGIGQTRAVRLGDGEPTIERLEARDDATRTLTYSIVAGPVPFATYESTMRLADAGDGRTTIDWTGTFEPAAGTTEEEAAGMVRGIYRGGIKGLQRHFAG